MPPSTTTRRRSRGEGSLYTTPRANGSLSHGYEVVLRDALDRPTRLKKSGFRTQREAQQALRALLAQHDAGRLSMPSKVTLATYTERWLERRAADLATTTLASYSKNLRLHILPRLGSLPLSKITKAHVEQMTSALLTGGRADHLAGQGLSPRTTAYVLGILKSVLADAVEDDVLSRNPAEYVKPPRQAGTERTKTIWTGQQVGEFLKGTRLHPFHTPWLLLATTGLRRGEALGLMWGDLDADAGRLRVQRSLVDVDRGVPRFHDTKTVKGRRLIALDPGTVEALRAHRAHVLAARLAVGAGAPPDDSLMFTRDDFRPIHPDRFSANFRETVATLGLPPIRVHDLRHTWATLALVEGVHPKVVQERLGHTNISITLDTYSSVVPGMDGAAAAAVAAVIGFA